MKRVFILFFIIIFMSCTFKGAKDAIIVKSDTIQPKYQISNSDIVNIPNKEDY